MQKDIKDSIGNFKNLKVLVVGDAILDTYIYGNTDRICREAPVPVFNKEEEKYRCGGAANTAINLAMLGAQTFFLTVLGDDFNGSELLLHLRQHGVYTTNIIRDHSRKTIAKKRVIALSNMLLRIDEGTVTDIDADIEKQLLEKIYALSGKMDAMLFSDYGFGILTDSFIQTFQTFAKKWNKPLLVDAKDLRKFRKWHPTAVKPNYGEALTILGDSKPTEESRLQWLTDQEENLFNKTNAQNVVLTLDEEGTVLFSKGKKPYHVSCIPRNPKNTIGAGDTFISALTLAMASGLQIKTCVDIAAAAASIVVQKEGTVGCSNIQLKSYFNPVPKFISGPEELKNILQELRKKEKKIVFTNGCFDLIHKGHVALLNQARRAGDVLIVGVNDDESVKKVKGPDRPVNTLEDRITVLSGLQSVDYLVSFSEESPLQLIESVHPDVFVKGAEYTETSIPELPLLQKLKTEVKIIKPMPRVSTTNIIHRINELLEETQPGTAGNSIPV